MSEKGIILISKLVVVLTGMIGSLMLLVKEGVIRDNEFFMGYQ